MCSVSAVIHDIKTNFPPLQSWTYRQIVDLSEVIKRLDKIDKALGAKDCYEPTKEDFLKQLSDRIAALEKHVGA